uniref:pulmonary surfactant-associated protein A-like n=1 Tax=Styela clava TaxID=7725 RepID=UPI00193A6CB1|nr:pulmonary surfactant-associated protein A-like [Styela clava]
MLTLKTLGLLLLVSWSNAFDDTPACTQIENLFQTLCARDGAHTSIGIETSQGSPGKRGPVGEKGEIGRPGPVGPPAIVDYERIKTEIDEKIVPVISQSAANNNALTLVIEKFEERIKILENREGACEIKFDGKCYWVESLDHGVTGYDRWEATCAERNGSPANIYSEKHYNVIMRYLRAKIFAKRSTNFLWVGMRTNPATGIVTLSDGSRAPFMKWYPGYPSKSPAHTHMTIVQRVPSSSVNIGIHNCPPTSSREGVLCEL